MGNCGVKIMFLKTSKELNHNVLHLSRKCCSCLHQFVSSELKNDNPSTQTLTEHLASCFPGFCINKQSPKFLTVQEQS